MRKEKGVTLVSLVVTIIILIILAGISINILLGEQGIITRAQQAKENMQIAQIEEQEGLNYLHEQLSGYDAGIGEGSVGDLANKLQELQNKFDTIEAEYSDFKTTIANAITEKGIETLETDTASIMAENIKKLGGAGIIKLGTVSFDGTGAINNNNSKTFNVASVYEDYANLTVDNFIDMTGAKGYGKYMTNWSMNYDAYATINGFSYDATTGVLTIKYTSHAGDSARVGSVLTIPIYIVV